MNKSVLTLFFVIATGLLLYPPLQFCSNGCYPLTNHGWIFDIPFLNSVDYARLAIYIVIVAIILAAINWIIGRGYSSATTENNVDEDLLSIVLEPTLLKISEDVAFFRTQGMSEKDAENIINEMKSTFPKIVHPYLSITIKNVYKLPNQDVILLAKKSKIMDGN